MLEERNQRGCNRYHLLRRNVHVVNFFAWLERSLTLVANCYQRIDKAAFFIKRRACLRNNEITFVDRRQIIDLICHFILNDFTIRAFEEAIVIRTRVSRERVDKTDIWSLWRLDRAYTSVVSRVHVAHFETCALAGQTTRTESRNAALVRDLRQWIVLIHKL